jgi:carboxymethylenebutenolidase
MPTQLNPHQAYLVEEFAEDYLENKMQRRDMLRRVVLITGSVPLAASTLLALGCSGGGSETKPSSSSNTSAAPAATPAPPTAVPGSVGPGVPETDPAITASAVEYPGQGGPIKAYIARPKDRTGVPAVVIVHENRGLTDHFKDLARRYAKEGFVGLAVDLLSRAGGTTADANANTAALGTVSRNPADLTADLVSSVNYLKTQPFVKATAIGATGFCFGGGYAWEVTAASPDIKASVPYYGTVTPTVMDNMTKIAGPVLMVYAGNDTRINAQMEDTKAKMAAANKPFEQKVYPNVNHAFFNDTGQAYNKEAADDAWKLTIAHFKKNLV